MRKYRPDFIVRIQDRDNRHGDDDLLNLVVEIKGYRGEDAKEKKNTMDNYWVGCRASTGWAVTAAGPSPSSPTCMRCSTTLRRG